MVYKRRSDLPPPGMPFESPAQKVMRTILKILAGLVIAGLLAACHSTPDNVKTAEKANAKRDDTLNAQKSVTDSTSVPSKQDADFMIKATSGSEKELRGLAAARRAVVGEK